MHILMFVLLAALAPASAFAHSPFAMTPVERFAEVDANLYRGGAPKSLEEMHALRMMGIRTLIDMQHDPAKVQREIEWAKHEGIHHVWIPLPGFHAPKVADVERIQKMMRDESMKPLMIHCTYGRERTGLEAALYRVSKMKWSPKKAYLEWRLFGFRAFVFPMKRFFYRITHGEHEDDPRDDLQ